MEMRRVGGRVVAMRDGENMYSVPADDAAPLWSGAGSEISYGVALSEGILQMWDDDEDGPSCGLHGHLYV